MKHVLFVCVHNAGRSQMAEAFFNQLAAARHLPVQAESAGTKPAERVNPMVDEAMREVGIGLQGTKPKRLTNAMIQQANRVITMGCAPDASSCPAIFVANVEDWALPDPAGKPLPEVRRIRDEIRRRVAELAEEYAHPSDQSRCGA